jgi:catechol 2,3-dioxygenase-like lactoylglutathione lyase family enzyme
MVIKEIDQIAIPIGGEDAARPFYAGLLALIEVPKPEPLASRGGLWFEAGEVKVHLGVERDFRANDKAHVAFEVEDVAALVAAAKAAGWRVRHDEELPGFVRAFIFDPFGNRVEVIQPKRD